VSAGTRLLDPGFDLTLRPMRYPRFYEMYRDAIRNTWTVEEVDFAADVNDLRDKLGPAERHLVERLVAFFAVAAFFFFLGVKGWLPRTARYHLAEGTRVEAGV